MFNILNYPVLILVVSLSIFLASSSIGTWVRKRRHGLEGDDAEYFKFLLGSVLTLLALIIGFTFSMAVNRYDQRKNLEEQEANAIGTEYVRADLLPSADAKQVRALLKSYLDQRMLNYTSGTGSAETARLQAQMWSAVVQSGADKLLPVTALAVAG